MERNQFWVFLGFGVVFGLSVELMKHVDWTPGSVETLGKNALIADEAPPVYKPSFKAKKQHIAQADENPYKPEHEPRVGGLDAEPGAAVTAEGDTSGKVETKSPEEKKKEEEKKKKAEEKKKKKKKKKKSSEKKDDSQPTDESEDEEDKQADAGDPGAVGGTMPNQGPGGFLGGTAGVTDPNAIPETLEEWERFILPQANFDRVSLLIKLYQTGVVKSDVYFEITSQMLEDSRREMREMGVMALGQTPSARAFSMLTTVMYQESGTTSLKTQIQTYLRLYTQLQNLRHLAGAIVLENDPNANYEALRLFQISAEYYLKNAKPQNPTEQGNDPTTPRAPAASSVTRYFNPFVTVLTRVTQSNSADSGVRQAANQALTNLQTLLSKST